MELICIRLEFARLALSQHCVVDEARWADPRSGSKQRSWIRNLYRRERCPIHESEVVDTDARFDGENLLGSFDEYIRTSSPASGVPLNIANCPAESQGLHTFLAA